MKLLNGTEISNAAKSLERVKINVEKKERSKSN